MIVCLYIDTLNGTGGTERITATLSNYLVGIDVEVHIITKRGGFKSFYKLDPRINQHCLHEQMDINIYKTYLFNIYKYRSIVKEINPNYIIDIGVNLSLETIPASIFRGISVVSWEHFNANVYHNYYINYISKKVASIFSKSIVVLTEEDKRVYQNKFKAKNVSVVPYPVSIDVNGYSYNNNSKYVLNIGRLTSQKGTDLLLNSWSLVRKKYSDWALRIVGDGELKEKLVELSKDLELENSVEFIEPSLNILNHFSEASIFVMASRYEGLPLVMIEAKCFGLPMVSFDCETGPRQIIRHNIDGILVEPNNVEELANSICYLISNPDLRIDFSNQAIIDGSRFSPEIFFDRWKAILNII